MLFRSCDTRSRRYRSCNSPARFGERGAMPNGANESSFARPLVWTNPCDGSLAIVLSENADSSSRRLRSGARSYLESAACRSLRNLRRVQFLSDEKSRRQGRCRRAGHKLRRNHRPSQDVAKLRRVRTIRASGSGIEQPSRRSAGRDSFHAPKFT